MSSFRKSILMAVLVFVLFCQPGGRALADEPAANLYKNALRSVAIVKNSVGRGTGWLVDEANRLLVTNYHVVGDDLEVTVIFPVMKDGALIADGSYYDKVAPRQRGRVIDVSEKHDLAVVQLDSWPADGLALALAGVSAGPGDTVHSIGNPGASEARWVYTNGAVRAVYQKKWTTPWGNRMLRVNTRVVETQSPINPGDSGGPLLNNDGVVVGVTQGLSLRDRLFSWFVDVSEVRPFVEQCLSQLEPASAEDFLHRGERRWWRRLYDRAIEDFSQAIRLDPESALAHSWRGAAYLLKNDLDNALSDINRAIELDSNNARAWLRRGSIFWKKRDFGQAIAEYSRAIDLDPKFAQAYYLRGCVSRDEKDFESAISDFAKAIRLDPDFSDAYFERAIILRLQKKYQQAIVDYGHALKGAQDLSYVLNDRGCVAFDLKQWNQAATDWNEAVTRNPKNVLALTNMALIFRMNREFDKALQLCNKAIAVNGASALAYFRRGDVLEAAGNNPAADEDYERAIQRDTSYAGKIGLHYASFLRVVNKTNSTLRLHLLYECHTTDGWLWYPSTDLDNPTSWTIPPGSDVSLLQDNWKVKARRIRIWAEDTENNLVWDRDRDRDLWMVRDPYRAQNVGTFTYTFDP